MRYLAALAATGRWPLRARLGIFAFGDFAFNLYWQSVMLYLLFYYSEALDLDVATAATTFMIASIWDGIASFLVGAFMDRRGRRLDHRWILMAGSIPLGLAFILAYLPPPVSGAWGIAFIVVGHMVFRTAYALVNVPYLAMSARISADSRDRALVAGLRMLSGTAALILVAMGTLPIGRWLTGTSGSDAPLAYFGAAVLFGVIGSAILFLVGATFRSEPLAEEDRPPSLIASLRSLLSNRAFVTLNLAMMAMIVGVTMLNKSVLYYFKYLLNDEGAGQLALASMGLVSSIAVPLWMVLARPLGARGAWFLGVGLCLIGFSAFALFDFHRVGAMQLFLMGMQAAIVGLNFAFWAMLPDTIEFGQRATGLRVEGTVFGLAALLQRIAIGIATALFGWTLGSAGYVANVAQNADTLAAMRWTVAMWPLLFLALSGALMLLNPLHKGAHDRIVGELAARRGKS